MMIEHQVPGKAASKARCISKADLSGLAPGSNVAEQILFLLEVFSLTGEQKYLQSVKRLAGRSYADCRASAAHLGYTSGCGGVVYAFLKAYEVTLDKEYLEQATGLVTQSDAYFLNSVYVGDSLYEGRAGVVLILLYLFAFTGDRELLVRMDSYSRKIIGNAVSFKEGLAWYNPRQLVIQPLASFGHGAAGIGYVFRKLGDYFDHEPFCAVAEKAFAYVNQSCRHAETGLWYDFRKDIADEKDLAEHRRQFGQPKADFFTRAPIAYSIENGVAGIAYAQLHTDEALAPLAATPAVELPGKDEKAGLLQLYLALYGQYKRDAYLKNAEVLLNSYRQCAGENEAAPEAGMLEVACLKGEPCDFRLPGLTLPARPDAATGTVFCSGSEVSRLLARHPFSKTLSCLSELEAATEPVRMPGQRVESAREYIENRIGSLRAGATQRQILGDIFGYEQRLLDRKLKQRQNAYCHIRELTELTGRIASLDVTDQELLKKKIVFSPLITVEKTYFGIKNLTRFRALPPKVEVFWKYDAEEGVSEFPFGFWSLIILRFKKPKTIATVLLEMQLYVSLLSEKKLKALIKESASQSKSHLAGRVPHIFLSELRLLMADGILVFARDQPAGRSLRNSLLRLLLRIATGSAGVMDRVRRWWPAT